MRLVLHRRVRSDVDQIMEYYKQAGQAELAQDFYRELRGFLLDAARRPARYHFFRADLRRVNLKRFPITSCTGSPAILCGSWSFDTIAGIRITVWGARVARDTEY